MEFFILAVGIAAAGYFIGEGLKNFNNPSAKNVFDRLDEDDEQKLIKESEVHHYIGVSKEDAKRLIQEHSDIPHLSLNGKTYFPKSKLREWLLKIGD
ncbi:helix-turn-helix domain-containing protein [Bacillus taeanensis]|uniref:DNA-binding protein n=1 Tax=Bacillus taeanensis TaxID=273032 RepID=A0A366XPH0_9BACI|nr:helix-turn-helix domain-containing protein [Bacillus taeanensis]RBW68260.1 DNA-binding protein [Bacillus taeanensis]